MYLMNLMIRYILKGQISHSTVEYTEMCIYIDNHIIDIVNPDEQFSVARYCQCAKQAIDSIHAKGKPAVMVGGTGLYVDSLVNNIQFSEIEPDEQYRTKMDLLADEKGNGHIYNMLIQAFQRGIYPRKLDICINTNKREYRQLGFYKFLSLCYVNF